MAVAHAIGYTKAFELRDRASEREKLGITGDYYQNVTGVPDKAEQTFQLVLRSSPGFAKVVIIHSHHLKTQIPR